MSPTGDAKDEGGYKSQRFRIDGKGDWDACFKFLTGMCSMKRLTRLDAIELYVDKDPKAALAQKPECTVTVVCSTFFKP